MHESIMDNKNIGRQERAARVVLELRKHPEAVKEGIETALQNKSRFDHIERMMVLVGFSKNIPLSPDPSPEWMSRRGLYRMVAEISSSKVWGAARKKAGISLTRIQDIETRYAISTNNAAFFTSGVALGMLAAANAPEVETRKKPVLNTSFLGAIKDIFPKPAGSPEEYMDRVKTLVPNPHSRHDKDKTLLTNMIDHGAFRKPGLKCPAISLTRTILDQWGEMLDIDDKYRDRFRSTVFKA